MCTLGPPRAFSNDLFTLPPCGVWGWGVCVLCAGAVGSFSQINPTFVKKISN